MKILMFLSLQLEKDQQRLILRDFAMKKTLIPFSFVLLFPIMWIRLISQKVRLFSNRGSMTVPTGRISATWTCTTARGRSRCDVRLTWPKVTRAKFQQAEKANIHIIRAK